MDLNTITLLTWFVLLVAAVISVLIIVAFYGVIKHFGNCPTCGRKISNQDELCKFCGTERLTMVQSAIGASGTERLAEQHSTEQIHVKCLLCGKDFDIKSSLQDTEVQCPHCKKIIRKVNRSSFEGRKHRRPS